MAIDPVTLGSGPLSLGTQSPVVGAPKDAGGFAKKLGELVATVEEQGAKANSAVSAMLDKTGDVHDAMIALQRAEMTLQLTVQVRNKMVSAYQEIMRMPV